MTHRRSNPVPEYVDDMIAGAVARAMQAQPWYERRKNTIIAALSAIIQIANIAVLVVGDTRPEVSVAIAVIVGVVEALSHALTRGAITPSMGPRIAAHTPPTNAGVALPVSTADLARETGKV